MQPGPPAAWPYCTQPGPTAHSPAQDSLVPEARVDQVAQAGNNNSHPRMQMHSCANASFSTAHAQSIYSILIIIIV